MIKSKKFIAIILVFAFVFGVFLINEYSLITADKIAIVVGLGIDKVEDEYLLSAQVVIPPSATKQENDKTNNTLLLAKGKTVAETVDKLFLGTGWYPKLNFCNIIVMSEEVAKEGVLNSLEYFLRSEKVMDSCILLIAKDCLSSTLLKASTPLDNVSSYTLQKILFEEGIQTSVIQTNIKDFYERILSGYVSNVVPTGSILKKSVDASEKDTQSALLGQYDLFDLTTSAIFNADKLQGFLDKNDTRVYNLVAEKSVETTLEFTDFNTDLNKDITYSLQIINENKKIDYSLKNNVPTMTIDLEYKVKMIDSSYLEDKERTNVVSLPLDQDLLKSGEEKITEKFEHLFATIKNLNCDIFGVGKKLNAYSHKKWDEYINYDTFYNYPSKIDYQINLTLTTLKEDKP